MKLAISTALAFMLMSGNVQSTELREIRTLASYIQDVNPRVSEVKAKAIASAIVVEAKKAKISVDLVTAIVEVESTFRVNAVSSEGAVGLMQVHRKSHPNKKASGIKNNVRAGVSILKDGMKKSKTLKGALKRYSGGHKGYHRKVLKSANKYKEYRRKES